jgi:hypothetical protein
MSDELERHEPGDVVNDHVLTKDGTWVPLRSSDTQPVPYADGTTALSPQPEFGLAPSPSYATALSQQTMGVQQVIAHIQKPIIPGRGAGIASMVLGIVAWVVALFTFGFGAIISIPLGIIGLAIGWHARTESTRGGVSNGQATAGLILSGTGLALVGIVLLLSLFAAASG